MSPQPIPNHSLGLLRSSVTHSLHDVLTVALSAGCLSRVLHFSKMLRSVTPAFTPFILSFKSWWTLNKKIKFMCVWRLIQSVVHFTSECRWSLLQDTIATFSLCNRLQPDIHKRRHRHWWKINTYTTQGPGMSPFFPECSCFKISNTFQCRKKQATLPVNKNENQITRNYIWQNI